MSTLRIAVVGAGIIGLAVAYQLTKAGAQVVVIDREREPRGASVVNAGGIAVTEVVPASSPGIAWRVLGWMTDPLGPLAVRPLHAPRLLPWLVKFAQAGKPAELQRISRALASLNARVYVDLLPMLEELGLRGELHARGALSVYSSESGFQRDLGEWAIKRAHGIETQELTGAEARDLEPALGPAVLRAVFTPQWSHIDDPERLVQTLKRWLSVHGTNFLTAEVQRVRPTVERGPVIEFGASSPTVAQERVQRSPELTATHGLDRVVIAAGAWSGELVRKIGDRILLESERGYNVTLPSPRISLRREIIFAENKFVATPLTCGLRIGGAAEFGGLKARPNFKRSTALLKLATRYLPALDPKGGINMQGHRPATPDSLPVIGCSSIDPRIIYAFGHGHLGLTQAATTGRLIRELIFNENPSVDLSSFSVRRFGRGRTARDAGA